MGKVYLSGPLSAATEEGVQANKARMRAAEAALQAAGFTVVCPLDNGLPENAKWEEHMRADVRLMLADDVDTVALMDGWHDSRGARIEAQLAKDLGMRVLPIVIRCRSPEMKVVPESLQLFEPERIEALRVLARIGLDNAGTPSQMGDL